MSEKRNATTTPFWIEETTPSKTTERQEHEELLQASLSLFDFSAPLQDKREGIWRMFFNNCNGLEANTMISTYIKQQQDKKQYNYLQDVEAPTKLDSLIRQMKIWNVDIVNLAEVGVAWENKIPRQVIQNITQQYEKTGCWTVSSSEINVGSYVKPGGTGIFAMGRSNGTILERGVDPWFMGRWSYILLAGKREGAMLLVITGYRTGKRSGPAGIKTAYSQQKTMLTKEGRNEQPEEAFFIDMAKWLVEYRQPHTEVLLWLDANEQWSARAKIAQFARQFELININQEMELPATHPNIADPSRSTTIDFGLYSRRVLENIRYAGAVPYDLDTLGDHRGVIMDINMESMLGVDKIEEEMKTRKLVMSNQKAVTKYLQYVEEKLQVQNIFQRTKKLLKRVAVGETDIVGIMKKYEAIDKEVHGICSQGEKHGKTSWAGNYTWSPKLVTAIKKISYWRLRLRSQFETVAIKHAGTELGIIYTHLSQSEKQHKIQENRGNLSKTQSDSRNHRQDHLHELATSYAAQNNVSTQTAVLELISHEDTRHTFKLLRSRLKPVNTGQLKSLWTATDNNGEFVKDNINK